MTRRNPNRVVEVIAPTGAPHLARIADELAVRVHRQLATLPPDALSRLLGEGEAIAKGREEFDQFLLLAGVR